MAGSLVSGCGLELQSDREIGRENCVPGSEFCSETNAATTTATPSTTSAPTTSEAPVTSTTTTSTTETTTTAPSTTQLPIVTAPPAETIPNEVTLVPDFSASRDDCVELNHGLVIHNNPYCDGFVLNSDGAGGVTYPHEAYDGNPGEGITVKCRGPEEFAGWVIVGLSSDWADTTYADTGFAQASAFPGLEVRTCRPEDDYTANF